jgi:hypothetical protein
MYSNQDSMFFNGEKYSHDAWALREECIPNHQCFLADSERFMSSLASRSPSPCISPKVAEVSVTAGGVRLS